MMVLSQSILVSLGHGGFIFGSAAVQLPAAEKLVNEQGINAYEVKLRVLACNVCTHTIYFAPGFPEEAANKGWKVI
jgi:hypothetical protein